MTPYRPPEQSSRGQFLDAIFILVLLFGTLFVTTYIEASRAGGGGGGAQSEPTPLAELPITEAERVQFQKLIDEGATDLATVNDSVEANRPDPNQYDFSVIALAVTVIVIVAYLAFVYRTSFREYREVIEEKFGPREGSGT